MPTPSLAGPGFRKIDSWTGRWRWNAKTAVFSDPLHGQLWQSQVQDIAVDNGRLSIRNDLHYMDGSRRRWTLDSALDGQPRSITWDDDGSVMTVIAFFQLDELRGGDAFFAPGGAFSGSEYFIIADANVKVWGSTTVDSKQFTYFEEWDRIG